MYKNTISQNKLVQNLFIVNMLGLTLGSGVYLYISLIRLDIFVILPSTIFLSFLGMRLKYSYSEMFLLVLVVSYISIAVISATQYPNTVALLDTYYMLSIYNIMMFMFILLKNEHYAYENLNLIYNTLYYLLILIVISMVFQMITGYKFVNIANENMTDVISSFFNNPNNLAATSLMMFLPILYLSKTFGSKMKNSIIFSLEFFILSITMSRFSLFLFFVIMAIALSTNIYLIVSLSIIFAFITLNIDYESILLSLMHSDIGLIATNAKRLWLALYSLEGDKSVSYRSQIYEYFVSHFNTIEFLGLGLGNYSSFFHAKDLASQNPHSLIIESFLAFGLLGGLVFMLIGILFLLKGFSKNILIFNPLIVSTFVFFAITFVPSSSIRLAIMWLPLFLFFVLYKQEKLFQGKI